MSTSQSPNIQIQLDHEMTGEATESAFDNPESTLTRALKSDELQTRLSTLMREEGDSRVITEIMDSHKRMTSRIHSLESTVQQAKDQLKVPPTRPTSPSHEFEIRSDTFKMPKIKAPDTFSGDRAKYNNFIGQVKLYIAYYPHRFTTEKSKILFVGSFLKEAAFAWFDPYLKRDLPGWDTFEKFEFALKNVFGDVDEEATASRTLSSLKQKGSAAQYTSEFIQVSSKLSWDNNALAFAYYKGLKDSVKDELARLERIENLSKLAETAIKIDNRLHERRQERKGVHTHIAKSESPHEHHDPMDLDATTFGRISKFEKDRRRRHGLCLYCGSSAHLLPKCTRRPNQLKTFRPKLQALATLTSNPSRPKAHESGKVKSRK